MVDHPCRFESLRQTIDSHRDELTIAARRQPAEGFGGALRGGPSELKLPETRVRVSKVQIERCEELLASPIGYGLGVPYGQLVPMQCGGGGQLMACKEVRRNGRVKVITPGRPRLLEEMHRFVWRTVYRHALGAKRNDRIGRIHLVRLFVLVDDACDHLALRLNCGRSDRRNTTVNLVAVLVGGYQHAWSLPQAAATR